MEDYEYLVMARRAIGEKRTDAIVAKMVKNLIEYETDPETFEANRRALGKRDSGGDVARRVVEWACGRVGK